MAAIAGIASRGGYLKEVGVFNTTTTAFACCLRRITTAGTPGTGQTEGPHNTLADDANDLAVFDLYTSTGPTLGAILRVAAIGAAVGAGVIWTFGGDGLLVPAGTANGIAIMPHTGTGQIADVYFDWQE